MVKHLTTTITLATCALVLLLGQVAPADAGSVRGYFRKDGTYVQPHYRSNPDGNVWNNWSTRGNINPYTGEWGTRNPVAQPLQPMQPMQPWRR